MRRIKSSPVCFWEKAPQTEKIAAILPGSSGIIKRRNLMPLIGLRCSAPVQFRGVVHVVGSENGIFQVIRALVWTSHCFYMNRIYKENCLKMKDVQK